MNSKRTTNLKDCYKYVYTCKECKRKYGSDRVEEQKDRVCPDCLGEYEK